MSWGRAFCLPIIATISLLSACSDEHAGDALSATSTDPPGTTQAPTAGASAPSTPGAAGSAGARDTAPPQRTAAAAGAAAATAGTAAPTATSGAAGDQAAAPAVTPLGPGMCCPDGKCLCRAEPPRTASAEPGPHSVMQYAIEGRGCVFYPTDAAPPYAAIAIADGFGGGGGCDSVQTDEWGSLYASHGIVSMIIESGTGDPANARGEALLAAIATFKAENERGDSPLFGKLAGRYGTSGFSTGGGGSAFAAQLDATLLSSVAIMPWGAAEGAGKVPTLIVCGESDGVAPCSAYGTKAYAEIESTVPKMRVTVASGHNGQPSAAAGATGAHVLAFQKLFLEGDERWRPLVTAVSADESTIQ